MANRFQFLDESQTPQKFASPEETGLISTLSKKPQSFKEAFHIPTEDFLRQPARQAVNLATLAAGMPGNILEFGNELIARPLSTALTGKESVPYQETTIGKALPTTAKLRAGIQKDYPYLAPKNKIEKFADDIIEDTALLFSPAKIARTGLGLKSLSLGQRLGRSFAKAVGINLGGEAVSEATGKEELGSATKMGGLFLSSLIDLSRTRQLVGNLYNKAKSMRPKNANINAANTMNKLDAFRNKITKGRPRESLSAPEEYILKKIDDVERLNQNGTFNIEQLEAQKISLNNDISKIASESPDRTFRKNIKNQAKSVNHILNESLGEYGRQNPNYYKNYKAADEAYATMAKSNFVTNWMKDHWKGPLGEATAHTLGFGLEAVPPYQIAKWLYKVIKSPNLRKIYGKTIKAAVKEDIPAFSKYSSEFNKKMSEDENPRYQFID